MRIALFGGSFDPPHRGHFHVAEEITTQSLVASDQSASKIVSIVDEVWFVPVYQHPWADKLDKTALVSYHHRKKMVELMLPTHARLKEYLDVSYTYPTLTYFSQKYPQHQFSWLMGSEYLTKFKDFLDGHPRLIDFPFYIYPRTGFSMEPLYENMIPLANLTEVDISSTEVKKKLQAGEDVTEYVHPAVAAYINQQHLYQIL